MLSRGVSACAAVYTYTERAKSHPLRQLLGLRRILLSRKGSEVTTETGGVAEHIYFSSRRQLRCDGRTHWRLGRSLRSPQGLRGCQCPMGFPIRLEWLSRGTYFATGPPSEVSAPALTSCRAYQGTRRSLQGFRQGHLPVSVPRGTSRVHRSGLAIGPGWYRLSTSVSLGSFSTSRPRV